MIDLDDFVQRTGIARKVLTTWIEREWLVAEHSSTLQLSEMDAARARLIHQLEGDFGINDEGIEIVLHLLDQIHGLRRALETMQRAGPAGQGRVTRRGSPLRQRYYRLGKRRP
ncbi:MAG: hypothetical protein JHD35_23725 [Sphingopyxis sp.]|nr:hypothetical protein [Sphingopyxis sp.]TAK06090.1 MAG: hypothetical protein EPO38_14745 [Rhizorhabdus sp.]